MFLFLKNFCVICTFTLTLHIFCTVKHYDLKYYSVITRFIEVFDIFYIYLLIVIRGKLFGRVLIKRVGEEGN